MGFWIIVFGLALLCCVVLIRATLQGRTGDAPPAAYDLQVYRDQLKDVERDLARKVISPEDAERVRTEVSRRILAADAQLKAQTAQQAQPGRAGLGIGLFASAVILGGATLIYDRLGAPGYRDLPLSKRLAASDAARENRLTQAEAEADLPPQEAWPVEPELLALIEQLREAVAARPGDVQGLTLLVRNEAGIGNFAAAYIAQTLLIAAKGPEARAEDFSILADLMVTAAQGYVSQEAETALRAALARDPQDGRAQYYLGVLMIQIDRPDTAFRLWRNLLENSPTDAPWMPQILNRIGEVALRAGVRYDLPDIPGLLSGPDEAVTAAASQLSPQERENLIRGMVASLSSRLAAQGGTSEEWARLIRAYGVLEETDQARAIYTEALNVFGNDPAALDLMRAAGQAAGVAP